jgi:hypothetical protein
MAYYNWTEPGQGLTYLWTQYKYRHELCWQAIYKITVAVILLGIVPYIMNRYVSDELMKLVRGWLWVPPVLAMCLAAFGILVVNNELRLFAATKLAHYRLENQLLGSLFRSPFYEELTDRNARWTLFDWYAYALVIALFLLSVGNFLFVLIWWIPLLVIVG